MSEIYQLPDNNGSNGMNIPFSIPIGGFGGGGLFGNGNYGMNDINAKRALSILANYNTGMCVSNDDVRMSGIFISKATNASEWWCSAIHEAKHAADAIIEYHGVDWKGEDAAYLTGYIVKRMVELVGEPCY